MKKHTWKNPFLGILTIGLLSFGLVFLYIERNRSLDALPKFSQRSPPNNFEPSVKIGIIGDSWVAGKDMGQVVRNSLLTLGIPSDVVSSGHPGANSRQIFRDLISEGTEPYSSRNLLLDEGLDYLVVVAGVNDTAGHMGKDFYAHHILQIIRVAQLCGVYPLVLEVPEYGIEDVPGNGFFSSVKHTIYRLLFDGTKKDVISDYREALQKNIPFTIKKEMTLVSFDPFVQNYSEKKDLYANPSHLNKEGARQLEVYLAQEIAKTHKINEKIKKDQL
jgi:hypothetical protein